MIKLHSIPHAPIAQGIEHRSPEPGAQVRILLGAPNPKRLTISSSEPFFCKGDAVNTDEKRDRELQTMERMIRIYCRSKHGTTGQMLCPDCEKILAYARHHIDRCPHMETKTFCAFCKTRCYGPGERETMKKIMRFSGPRMLLVSPSAALYHLLLSVRHRLHS